MLVLAAIALVAQIDRIANDAIRNAPAAGMSILVRHHGQTIVSRGYGFANLELQVPATENTVYHIDSITKHVTTGAILRLAAEKKLSLGDSITKYVQLPQPWQRVTIRHLLNHTSGSARYTSLPAWGPQERLDLTHQDILSLVRDFPFEFDPGTAWRYNNTGFYLLGLVIEEVTGKSYGDAMRELVFDPLQMTATRHCGFRPVIMNRASGYEVHDGKLVNAEPMSWAAPFSGGALCSTTSDLARYERGLEEHRLFDDAWLREMRHPTSLPDADIDYGFGTRLGRIGTHRVVGHTGTGGGFRNVLMRFPEDDLTIVILTNTDRPNFHLAAIAGHIAKTVLGIEEKLPVDLPVPSQERDAYTGRFTSGDDSVENVVNGDRIAFRSTPGGALTPLRYQGDGVFALTPDVIVVFTRRGGVATWGQSYVGGLFEDALRRVP